MPKEARTGSGSASDPLPELITEAQNIGETVTPPPDANLASWIQDYAGYIIDLVGRDYPLEQTLVMPGSRTEIRNGRIFGSDNAETQDFQNLQLIDTPDGSDYQHLTFRNLEIFQNNAAQRGIRTRDCQYTRHINPTYRSLTRGALSFEGKHSSGTETTGPLVLGGYISGCGGSGPAIKIGPERDYATFANVSVGDNNLRNALIQGENTSIIGGQWTEAAQEESILIDGTPTSTAGNKTKVIGTTLNHSGGGGVRAVDCEDVVLNIPHIFGGGAPDVELVGVQDSDVIGGITRGHESGETVIKLSSSSNRDCFDNEIRGWKIGTNDGDAADAAIREADSGAYGNKVVNNEDLMGAGFDLNSGDVQGNTPRVAFGGTGPQTPENYRVILADSGWDPNSTGGDSLVVTTDGGSSWTTVVAL